MVNFILKIKILYKKMMGKISKFITDISKQRDKRSWEELFLDLLKEHEDFKKEIKQNKLKYVIFCLINIFIYICVLVLYIFGK